MMSIKCIEEWQFNTNVSFGHVLEKDQLFAPKNFSSFEFPAITVCHYLSLVNSVTEFRPLIQ